MPLCNKCKKDKSATEFNFNSSKNRLEYHCKECHSEYLKSHYQRNKTYYKIKAIKRKKLIRKENKAKIFEYLQNHMCVDCGEKQPIFLDFDHVRGKKKRNVSQLIREGYSWEIIQKEIDKCEIRCVKCHRLKTYKQFGWYGWWEDMARPTD